MVVYSILIGTLVLIPLACFLYYQFFKDVQYNNKNSLIRNNFIVLSLLMIVFGGLFFASFVSSITHKEVRNYYITKVSHQERYSQKVVYFVQVYAGQDSKGRSRYRTERRVKTSYHGPYYIAHSSSGREYTITHDEYNKWKNRWGEKYIKTVVGTSAFLTPAISGKYYESFYNGKMEDVFPKPEIHSYKNVLRNSNSIFGFKYGNGIKHPVDNGNTNGVISDINLNDTDIALFANFNAIKGNLKQIHIITIITKNKANNAVKTINNWGGLNKNELAVFIGIDDNKNIIWTDAHSWMDNTKCQNMIRDEIMLIKKFDAKLICNIYDKNLQYWKRKEFKDFNYIEIPLPNSCKTILIFSIILFLIYLIIIIHYIFKNNSNLQTFDFD